jgi:hypothetical protein
MLLWLLMQSKAASATSLMEQRWIDGQSGVDDATIIGDAGG